MLTHTILEFKVINNNHMGKNTKIRIIVTQDSCYSIKSSHKNLVVKMQFHNTTLTNYSRKHIQMLDLLIFLEIFLSAIQDMLNAPCNIIEGIYCLGDIFLSICQYNLWMTQRKENIITASIRHK